MTRRRLYRRRLAALTSATLLSAAMVAGGPASPASAYVCAGVVREGQVWGTWTGYGSASVVLNTTTYGVLQGDFNASNAVYSGDLYNVDNSSYTVYGSDLYEYVEVTNYLDPYGTQTQAGWFNVTYCAK